jgi:hypothetical protein
MADYYPLIARAVAGLEKNTGDARRSLYERARGALVAQLRSTKPPMADSDITKERLALEEAIRRVEADTARRLKLEAEGMPASADRAATDEAREAGRRDAGARAPAMPRRESPGEKPVAVAAPAPVATPVAAPRGSLLERAAALRRPLSDEGLKGFRDVVAEAESLGEATAQASKSARDTFSAMPALGPQIDRLEPRMTEALRKREPLPAAKPKRETAPLREAAAPGSKRGAAPVSARREEPRTARDPVVALRESDKLHNRETPGVSLEPTAWPDDDAADVPPRIPPRLHPAAEEGMHRLPPSRRGMAAAIVTVLLFVSLAAVVFWQRDRVASLFNAVKGGATQQAARDAAPTRPKITDRVGQPAQDNAQPAPSVQPGAQPAALVAQRVVLYEEDPSEPSGKRYVGSAIWRTEMVQGPKQTPELAIRADMEIPERRMTMTLTLRRNSDQALPASHTIEIMFNLPADFPFGGIANVPGILMKQAEQTRGAPLAGLAVKVTSGFFLVGLSAVEGDQQRNLGLLKERGWFDIPVVYNNGRRAILAIEKGNPGDHAFEQAFAAWGQGG